VPRANARRAMTVEELTAIVAATCEDAKHGRITEEQGKARLNALNDVVVMIPEEEWDAAREQLVDDVDNATLTPQTRRELWRRNVEGHVAYQYYLEAKDAVQQAQPSPSGSADCSAVESEPEVVAVKAPPSVPEAPPPPAKPKLSPEEQERRRLEKKALCRRFEKNEISEAEFNRLYDEIDVGTAEDGPSEVSSLSSLTVQILSTKEEMKS
jgi:hypothetical protein